MISPRIRRKQSDSVLVERVQNQHQTKQDLNVEQLAEAPLMPFDGSVHTDVRFALPFTREDYFNLVDTTGRLIREDKRGAISSELPTIVARFGIDPR